MGKNVRPLQLPLITLYDERARHIEKLLRRMKFDDALISRRGWYDKWRVEYLHLDEGLPHYRVFCHEQLLGVVRIHSTSDFAYRDGEVAAYLAAVGFTATNTRLVRYGAQTLSGAEVNDVPYLFWHDGITAKKHRPRHTEKPRSRSHIMNV